MFTLRANFKTELSVPPDSFESPTAMETFEIVSDRELFSELFDNPINPLLINMVPPFVDENNPMFYLQINGEAVLKWRDVYGRPRTVFNLLQRSILPLGYGLKPSAQERVGNALRESIRRFPKKIGNTKKKFESRDLAKARYKTRGDRAYSLRRYGGECGGKSGFLVRRDEETS